MRVAVVGARGFIGSRLVDRLGASGIEVVPVARPGSGLREADALDAGALAGAFSGCDAAVHAIAGDPATVTGAIPPLLDAARKAGLARVVYLSSASVHGQSPAPGTDEQSPLAADQPFAYNKAKALAEAMLTKADGPEIVILRPGIVYGPKTRWLSDFARDWHGGSACLVDGGTGICNACHVDNLAEAVRLALSVPQAADNIFLVGDGEEMRWRDFYAPVAAAMGRNLGDLPEAPEPAEDEAHPSLSRSRRLMEHALRRLPRRAAPRISREMALLQSCRVRLPIDKAVGVLGYRPPVTKAKALAEAEAWLRAARPWDAAR